MTRPNMLQGSYCEGDSARHPLRPCIESRKRHPVLLAQRKAIGKLVARPSTLPTWARIVRNASSIVPSGMSTPLDRLNIVPDAGGAMLQRLSTQANASESVPNTNGTMLRRRVAATDASRSPKPGLLQDVRASTTVNQAWTNELTAFLGVGHARTSEMGAFISANQRLMSKRSAFMSATKDFISVNRAVLQRDEWGHRHESRVDAPDESVHQRQVAAHERDERVDERDERVHEGDEQDHQRE